MTCYTFAQEMALRNKLKVSPLRSPRIQWLEGLYVTPYHCVDHIKMVLFDNKGSGGSARDSQKENIVAFPLGSPHLLISQPVQQLPSVSITFGNHCISLAGKICSGANRRVW